jgi:hypothetical protein
MTICTHLAVSRHASLTLLAFAWPLLMVGTVLGGPRVFAAEPESSVNAEPEAHAHPTREAADDDIPSVDELCERAVEAALAEPERARSFVRRARLAGWLPETTFRVYRRFARTEGVTFEDPVTGAAVPVDIKAIDDVRYEWRATWDLSRIVFNPDEISAHFEALRLADVRRDIQMLVIRLFFERKRLLLEAKEPRGEAGAASPTGSEKRRLRVLEIEAQLDALSHGAFSARRTSAPAPASPPS